MKRIQKLRGGSLAKTEIVKMGEEHFVRKTVSYSCDREYGLVRWQSQIRKMLHLRQHLGERACSVVRQGICDDGYYYDMPYHANTVNCWTAVTRGECVEEIAIEICNLLDNMTKRIYSPSIGSMGVYMFEEIVLPLRRAVNYIENNDIEFGDGSWARKQIENCIKVVEDRISLFKERVVKESLTHGNMTLENLLWDSDSKKVIIIDPYAETYCENINGDYSQILQSTLSEYERVIANNSFLNWTFGDPYPIEVPFTPLREIASRIQVHFENTTSYDPLLADIYYGSQFTRMFPFKIKSDPRSAYGFLFHGIDILTRNIKC